MVPGYKVMDTCVTHDSSDVVDDASFIFNTDSGGQPQFSGFLVHDLLSYAAIVFNYD